MHFFAFQPTAGTSYWCSFQRLNLEQAATAGLAGQGAVFFGFGPAGGPLTAAVFPADGPLEFTEYAARMPASTSNPALQAAGYAVLMAMRGFAVEPPADGAAWSAEWRDQLPLPWM